MFRRHHNPDSASSDSHRTIKLYSSGDLSRVKVGDLPPLKEMPTPRTVSAAPMLQNGNTLFQSRSTIATSV